MDTFLQHWTSDELLTFDRSAFERLNINSDQVNFLTEIGLPKDAAPFLTFENELRTLNELYELDESEFETKIVIGSDGAGDPICIELTNQRIYVCDHEDDFEPRFMNTAVIELFKFLSLFKAFAEQLINDKGEDAFIDANFSDYELLELTSKLRFIDPTALETSTFWNQEFETLRANRKHYRNENTGDNKR
ncbi:MAG: SUKH-4 family immunity protein [Cyclobacteriaceae bacterium]